MPFIYKNNSTGGGSADVSGKADKVSGATAGNFAALDQDGNLKDSGKSADSCTSKQDIIESFCPEIQKTGTLVQMDGLVEGYPLGVKVSWEPTQEGEGTPYPAGGGKNLFRLYDKDTIVSANGLTAKFDLKAETLTVTGTSTKTDVAWLIINQRTGLQIPDFASGETYTLSWTKAAGIYVQIVYTDTSGRLQVLCYLDSTSVSFTVPENYVSFFAVQVGVNATVGTVSGSIKIQLEKGSTATAYAPYANIRPIHGRTAVSVERCGENLWSFGDVGFKQYKEISTNYPAGKYVLSCEVETESTKDTVQIGRCVDGNWVYSQEQKNKRIKISISASVGISAFRLYAGTSPADDVNATYKNIQLELGNEATVYEPCTADTNTLTLPSTVYGGEVDAVTGDGFKTIRIVTIDAKEIKFVSAGEGKFWNLPYRSAKGVKTNTKITCSHFSGSAFSANESYEFLFTQPPRMAGLFSSVEELNDDCAAQYAAGTPVQVCYELKEPVPFTTTGGAAIPALSGTNTVLTDADSMTVTGRADPIQTVAKLSDRIAALEAAATNIDE